VPFCSLFIEQRRRLPRIAALVTFLPSNALHLDWRPSSDDAV
jgi:hypothetical protein